MPVGVPGQMRATRIEPQQWASWLADPRRAGVFTDFDGTLAPIVDDPELAVPLPGMTEALRALVDRFSLVAVVSGRPVTYLVDHLGEVDGLTLVGLYGLERARGPRIERLPEAEPWRQAVEEAAAGAERGAPTGARVERKGLAVAFHVRAAPHLAGWMQTAAAEQAAATGLIAHPGRQSIELRPPVDADKGTVVAELAADLSAVCFFGDDRGDLPAFEALAALRRRAVTTMAVAVNSPELPAELAAAADWFVDGPPGVLEVLRYLAGAPVRGM